MTRTDRASYRRPLWALALLFAGLITSTATCGNNLETVPLVRSSECERGDHKDCTTSDGRAGKRTCNWGKRQFGPCVASDTLGAAPLDNGTTNLDTQAPDDLTSPRPSPSIPSPECVPEWKWTEWPEACGCDKTQKRQGEDVNHCTATFTKSETRSCDFIGDGRCDAACESSASSPKDCPASCGNGVCDAKESKCSCPKDCGSCTGCCNTSNQCVGGTSNNACGSGSSSNVSCNDCSTLGRECKAGVCQAPACQSGQTTCSGTSLRTCNNGAWSTVNCATACGSGSTGSCGTDTSGGAKCQCKASAVDFSQRCDPSAAACPDGTTVCLYMPGASMGWCTKECTSNQSCMQASGSTLACRPMDSGVSYCVYNCDPSISPAYTCGGGDSCWQAANGTQVCIPTQ